LSWVLIVETKLPITPKTGMDYPTKGLDYLTKWAVKGLETAILAIDM